MRANPILRSILKRTFSRTFLNKEQNKIFGVTITESNHKPIQKPDINNTVYFQKIDTINTIKTMDTMNNMDTMDINQDSTTPLAIEVDHLNLSGSVDEMTDSGDSHHSFIFRKYNNWRLHSLNNPVYSREGYKELHHSPEKFFDKLNNHRFSLVTYHVLPEIKPSEEEQKIFDFLLSMQEWCKQQLTLLPDKDSENYKLKKLVSETIPRVAGGWCRDKLLNMKSDDIDIALDNVDGEQYSSIIVEYQKCMGYEVRSIGVIQENPEQSKHLKTATTHIFGIGVDFVNLRSEEYGTNSRIPIIRFGTAEEDAYRRDLTINSLFYNIVDRKVEDLVGNGYTDLKNGIIRTPLPSYRTFLDDPLRIIRSIRMAARFHFLIADEIVDAASNHEIREALHSKISRERVGVEFYKILKNGDPVGALSSLKEMNVIEIILTTVPIPKKTKKASFEYIDPKPLKWTDEEWDNAMYRMRVCHVLTKSLNIDSEVRIALHMAALLSNISTSYTDDRSLSDWIDSFIMSSWRLPRKLSQQTSQIILLSRELHKYLMSDQAKNMNIDELRKHYKELLKSEKVNLGKWIRKCTFDYHSVIALSSVLHTKGNEWNENPLINGEFSHMDIFLEVLSSDILMEIQAMNLLLTGKEIMGLLNITQTGNFMSDIMNKYLEWQIRSWPCTKDMAIDYLKYNPNEFIKR